MRKFWTTQSLFWMYNSHQTHMISYYNQLICIFSKQYKISYFSMWSWKILPWFKIVPWFWHLSYHWDKYRPKIKSVWRLIVQLSVHARKAFTRWFSTLKSFSAFLWALMGHFLGLQKRQRRQKGPCVYANKRENKTMRPVSRTPFRRPPWGADKGPSGGCWESLLT